MSLPGNQHDMEKRTCPSRNKGQNTRTLSTGSPRVGQCCTDWSQCSTRDPQTAFPSLSITTLDAWTSSTRYEPCPIRAPKLCGPAGDP